MKHILMLLVAAATAGALVSASPSKASDLYQQGVYLQEVKGDLTAAIDVYQSIVTDHPSERETVARALFQMAACYEKLGRPEASRTYGRIVREYTAPADVVAAAVARLTAARPAAAQNGGEARRIATVVNGSVFDVNATGTRSVGVEPTGVPAGDIVVRDTQTGSPSVLVAGSAALQNNAPIFSPDGRMVAYQSMTRVTGQPPSATLHVMSTEPGATDRALADPGADYDRIEPVGWSPDGKSIVAVLRARSGPSSQLVSVSLATGGLRALRSLADWRGRSRLRLSPDGQFIAYSATHPMAQPFTAALPLRSLPQHLYVASVSGTDETEIVQTVGSHSNPVWTPDGSRVFFLSDRLGQSGLWSVAVQSGHASGIPVVVRSDFHWAPLAISQAGTLFCEEGHSATVQTYVVDRPSGRVVVSFQGAGGDYSPDGRLFAFKPAIGNGSEVVVRNMETGAERSYHQDNMTSASPHWLGNGGFLVGVSKVAPDGEALFYCDVATGVFRRLYNARTPEYQRWGFTTANDGARIYSMYLKGGPGEPITGIVSVNPNTGDNESVVLLPAPLRRSMPGVDVSGDGRTFVVMSSDVDGPDRKATLLVMNADGSGARQVGTPFPVRATPDLVRWTPDGTAILYVTTVNNRSRIMRTSLGGGAPEPEGVEVEGPIWNIDPSPDGTRLAYSTTAQPTDDLWALENILTGVR